MFTVGERVTCLIIAIEGTSNERISLSTAELEEADGDMLLDKVGIIKHHFTVRCVALRCVASRHVTSHYILFTIQYI